MDLNYESWTVVRLKDEVWNRGLIPKRWMLNYIRKAEAVYLLTNISSQESLPENYITTIKQRCSIHRKKVYKARKNRQAGFGASLSRDEKLKKVANSANKLLFIEVEQNDEPFTSYLGSTKGKLAFIFKDDSGNIYKFTRGEVEKLVSMGLYVPRGVISTSRTRAETPPKSAKTLKDIFGS